MNLRILSIAALAMIVLTSGCAVTPARPRDRIGDFVSHIATASPASEPIRG
jgi:hypothetical protein